jgi:DNA-binding HxlR family transcriptional regulator
MARDQAQAILFEILRSFTSLARTLNTSRSVEELGVTRQTLRRHLNLLEAARGKKMFSLVDRRYQLTEAGRNALPEAEELLARGDAWLNGYSTRISNMLHVTHYDENGIPFFLQQHPIGELWSEKDLLLQTAMRCWANAHGQIESEHFKDVRSYAAVYRWMGNAWICAEVGADASITSWLGWAWARSSIGRALIELPGGSYFMRLLAEPFEEVQSTQGARLDHVYTHIPRQEGGKPVPISYKRLLLGCSFPDGSPAIVSIIDRRYDIVIDGFAANDMPQMPEELVMMPEKVP